jgi:hypothetical protein
LDLDLLAVVLDFVSCSFFFLASFFRFEAMFEKLLLISSSERTQP